MLGDLTKPQRHPCTARSAQSLPMLCQEIEMRSYPPYLIIHPSTHRQWHTQHFVHDHSVVSSITAPCFRHAQLHTYSAPYLSFLHWLESHTDLCARTRVQHNAIHRTAKQQNKQTKKEVNKENKQSALFPNRLSRRRNFGPTEVKNLFRHVKPWVTTLQECEDYWIGKHMQQRAL